MAFVVPSGSAFWNMYEGHVSGSARRRVQREAVEADGAGGLRSVVGIIRARDDEHGRLALTLRAGDLEVAAGEGGVPHGGAPPPADGLDAQQGLHGEAHQNLGDQKVLGDGGGGSRRRLQAGNPAAALLDARRGSRHPDALPLVRSGRGIP